MKYVIDENNFIIRKAEGVDFSNGMVSPQLPENVVELPEEIEDFTMGWELNDFTCYKYKVVNGAVKENEIVFVGMTDINDKESIYKDGDIVSALTIDVQSIDRTKVVTFLYAEATNLLDEYNMPMYEKTGTKFKLKENYIDTEEKEVAKRNIQKRRIAFGIKEEISVDEELKVLKEFVEWIADRQPENDKREKKYLKMQKRIKKLKDKVKN